MKQPETQEELPHISALVAALASPIRFAVAGAIALGHNDEEQISEATGLGRSPVRKALSRLVAVGLVRVYGEEFKLRPEVLEQSLHRSRLIEEIPGAGEEAAELRKFIKKGRITSIPVSRTKRLILLDYLATRFEPGRYYSEKEVNAILTNYHDDYATLRRYMVDESFLTRSESRYWRTGGTVETG